MFLLKKAIFMKIHNVYEALLDKHYTVFIIINIILYNQCKLQLFVYYISKLKTI